VLIVLILKVYQILQTVTYGDEADEMGLNNLLHDKIFTEAFPLHEVMVMSS